MIPKGNGEFEEKSLDNLHIFMVPFSSLASGWSPIKSRGSGVENEGTRVARHFSAPSIIWGCSV